MALEQHAGNALLAVSSGTGVANVLAQADLVISIVVGCLSAVGIIYSIVWHRVRIKLAKRKANDKSNGRHAGRASQRSGGDSAERD